MSIGVMRLSGQLSIGSFINCNYSELHVTCWVDCLESKAVANYNCSMEIMGSAEYGLISELQLQWTACNCWKGCSESMTMANYNCGNEIMGSAKNGNNYKLHCHCTVKTYLQTSAVYVNIKFVTWTADDLSYKIGRLCNFSHVTVRSADYVTTIGRLCSSAVCVVTSCTRDLVWGYRGSWQQGGKATPPLLAISMTSWHVITHILTQWLFIF